jgi:DnaJ-domain-containing protein 1
LLSPSPWWWGAILWGLHQAYLGWSYFARHRRTSHERVEYVQSSVSVLAFIALVDGVITPREAAIIRDSYARAGFSAEDIRDVDRILRECERRFLLDGSDADRLFVLLRDACRIVWQHSNPHTRFRFFRTAILIATSDGFVSASERRALTAAAAWLGLSEAEIERAWAGDARGGPDGESDRGPAAADTGSSHHERDAREEPVVPPDLATYYASLLGVPVTASPHEIKRAYREKAKQYHPDVVTHTGPAFAREAEERFKELPKAYAFLRGTTVAT